MQKIIALDIGSYSIKAIEIMNKFSSYEVTNFYEKVIPRGDDFDPSLVPTCLEQIFKENDIVADRIITAMSGQFISSRIMTFNFSDPNKIEASVYSEIEDIVPFHLEDMIIDQQILGTTDGKTFTLVVMIKQEVVGTFLDNLKRINIDPKLIDIDSLSFYNLSPFLNMESGKCYGIVDIGHEKTSVCLVQDNILRMFRSINVGGRYITEFIARDMQISYNEAQRIKHQVSMVLTEGHTGQGLDAKTYKVAELMTLAAHSLARELGRTLYAFKTWEKSPIERIYISGGTSQIQNFDAYLTYQLSVETMASDLKASSLNCNHAIHPFLPVMAQGISIGVRAVSSAKKHSEINLRKGPYAYVQDYASILNTASMIAKLIAVSLLLLCVGFITKYFFFSSEINKIQQVYIKEASSVPDLKKKVKLEGQPFAKTHKEVSAFLKSRVERKRQAFDNFIQTNSDSGAMIALKQISANLPKEVKIDVVDYDFSSKPDGSGVLRLRVEADSFDTIAKLKESLGKVKVFSGLTEKSSDTKPGTDLKIAVLETIYNSNSTK